MTDDDPDVTPRTYADGDQHHSGAYRSLDPMQIELLRRLDRLDRLEQRIERGEHNVDLIDRSVTGLTSSRRFWGWAAGLGVPALIGAAFTLLLWSADRVSTSSERVGRTEARIEGQAELIKLLQQEIVELRRRAGIDVHPNSDMWALPDKFSAVSAWPTSLLWTGALAATEVAERAGLEHAERALDGAVAVGETARERHDQPHRPGAVLAMDPYQRRPEVRTVEILQVDDLSSQPCGRRFVEGLRRLRTRQREHRDHQDDVPHPGNVTRYTPARKEQP